MGRSTAAQTSVPSFSRSPTRAVQVGTALGLAPIFLGEQSNAAARDAMADTAEQRTRLVLTRVSSLNRLTTNPLSYVRNSDTEILALGSGVMLSVQEGKTTLNVEPCPS